MAKIKEKVVLARLTTFLKTQGARTTTLRVKPVWATHAEVVSEPFPFP